MSETPIAYNTALAATGLLLLSAITYMICGSSTGYIILLIAMIVGVSSIRTKRETLIDLKDAANTLVFFGLMTLLAMVLLLAGSEGFDLAQFFGIAGSLLAIIAGYLSYRSTKITFLEILPSLISVYTERLILKSNTLLRRR